MIGRLDREFFSRDAPVVAPQLLNKLLIVGEVSGRITEVEAYTRADPASHSFRGRTNRNVAMFGPAGHLYVYFTYGMHHCANVVVGASDAPDSERGQAVLIRAVEPLEGLGEMIRRRGRDRNIADGPGKLCQAFAIGADMNGLDLCGGGAVGIFDDGVRPPDDPIVTPRIGITVGTDTLWRWKLSSSRSRNRGS